MIRTPGPQQKCLSYLLQLPLVGTLYYVLANSRWKVKRDFRTKYYYNGDRIEPGMEDMFYEAAHLADCSALCICQPGWILYENQCCVCIEAN